MRQLLTDIVDSVISTDTSAWIDQVFNSGDFSASGGGTWTVQEENVLVNRYKIIGKTMYWCLRVIESVTINDPSTLLVTIPNSKTRKSLFFTKGIFIYNSTNGAVNDVYGQLNASNLEISYSNNDSFPNDANMQVSFFLVFEIQ
jgi:hypothetical protein